MLCTSDAGAATEPSEKVGDGGGVVWIVVVGLLGVVCGGLGPGPGRTSATTTPAMAASAAMAATQAHGARRPTRVCTSRALPDTVGVSEVTVAVMVASPTAFELTIVTAYVPSR